jgi:tetraprenyl-beta-curcumene synthase
MSDIGPRRFITGAFWALACAHARYWSSVAPIVRDQLFRWETHAAEIVDPRLRKLAQSKLANERFNAQAAAMIATVAPARHREPTVEAIVALQVMYDYLDALTEQPTADPIRDGLRYSTAFTDAVTVSTQPAEDYYEHHPGGGDDAGYLADLVLTIRDAIRSLPGSAAIAETIAVGTARFAEAQVRIHAAPRAGMRQLEGWAANQAIGTGLQWREWLFGAMGSVVAVHALIALAADEHSTAKQASELDELYLTLCVLTTALDHLVDYERDTRTGEQSYVHLYESRQELAQQVTSIVRQVINRARVIPNGPHHLMILSGVVAYYTSQPSAMRDFARPVTEHAREQLRPLITPTLATMHAWRLAKRLRSSSCAKRLTRTRNGRPGDRGTIALEGKPGHERETSMRADRGQDQPTRGVSNPPPPQ